MKFSKILLTTGLGIVIFTFNVQAVTPCGLELANGVWQRAKDGRWCPPNFDCLERAIGIDGCTTDIAWKQFKSENAWVRQLLDSDAQFSEIPDKLLPHLNLKFCKICIS